MPYEYWVVRYLPTPATGEFANVGVIAGSGQDWAMRKVANLDRGSRLGGHLGETRAFFSRASQLLPTDVFAADLFGLADIGSVRGEIEDLRARMCNVVQLSAPRPILAETAQQAADFAFGVMVQDQSAEGKSRAGTIARNRVIEQVQRDPMLASHLRMSQELVIGQQRTKVHFAIEDGDIRQINHVWDFSVKDTNHLVEKVRSWSFIVSQVRSGQGAILRSQRDVSQVLSVPRGVNVNCLYTPATSDGAMEQLEVARDAWRSIDVQAVPEGESDQILMQARELVAA